MAWPILIWETLVLLVAFGGLAAGIYFFKVLRKRK